MIGLAIGTGAQLALDLLWQSEHPEAVAAPSPELAVPGDTGPSRHEDRTDRTRLDPTSRA